jgi:hypothetical protein
MSRQLRICDAPAPKRALWVRLLVGVAALGCTYQVHVFTVEPALVCPGQPVKVAWQVDGPTSLRAEPKPNGWDDGEVASQGTRTVTPTVPTEFTVAAIKANKAKGNSQATKSVQIAKAGPGAELGSNTTCDASGICTGSLQFDGGAGPFV